MSAVAVTVAQYIPHYLILHISDYDYTSPIYFTNKSYYKKGAEIRNKAVIKLQEWYRKNMLKNYHPNDIWKSRGLMIRMYLGVYIGDYERFMLSLPDSIVDKFQTVNYIQEQEIKTGLNEAYRVFKQTNGKKSDVLRFLLNNKLNAEYYRIYGV